MTLFLSLVVLVSTLLAATWWQARPSDEDRFIQTARTHQLTAYLRQRGHLPAR